MKLVQDVTHLGYTHNPLNFISQYSLCEVLCFLPFSGVITPAVSHISFQFFVIEKMIFETLSNLLKFLFDYVLRNLFRYKGLILRWISLIEMKTNFMGRFSSTNETLGVRP